MIRTRSDTVLVWYVIMTVLYVEREIFKLWGNLESFSVERRGNDILKPFLKWAQILSISHSESDTPSVVAF